MSAGKAGRLGGRNVVLPLLFAGVAMLLPLVLDVFQIVQGTLWITYGLLALSLNLVWGQAGIFSFGQTAFFGIAGYVYGAVAINLLPLTGETTSAIVAAVSVAALMAASLGYFMFYGRVSEVYVGIITLAVTLVLNIFFASTADPLYAVGDARLGGYNGMTGIPPIVLGLPGLASVTLDVTGTYVFAVAVAVLAYMGLAAFLRARPGRVLAAIRENELRTELLGYDIRWHKLMAFTLGGALAGLSGALFAAWGLFINPEVFSLVQAAMVVIWVLVGGRGVMAASFLGVVLIEGISTTLGGITAHTTLILGLLLILLVLLLPNGLIPTAQALWTAHRRRRSSPVPAANAAVPPADRSGEGEPARQEILSFSALDALASGRSGLLEVSGLGVAFDGLKALDGVNARFGEPLHCIIGPNGAGKSTFFKLLVGIHMPTEGRILYAGRDITRLGAYRRARLGIGIKMQTASIYANLSVAENVWLAASANTRDGADAAARASEVLRGIGLGARPDVLAGHLSHGEKQWLEMGMVLAARPALILLDEPTAGMTWEETAQTAALVKRIAATATVVVVEHDMEFVRELAAPVTVLHQGQIFKRGTLDEIRNDEAVLDIYLGRAGNAQG